MATSPTPHPKCIKVNQYDAKTNELIQTFNSCNEAGRKLNISISGINHCCQYYKYTEETRPKCYKKLKSYEFYF